MPTLRSAQGRTLEAHIQRQLLRHTGTQPLGEAIERRFLDGEVHQLLLANHIPRHGAGTAQAVDQAQRQCLLTRPDQAGEQLRMFFILESLTAPLLDAGNKLAMSGVEHTLPELGFFSLCGWNGSRNDLCSPDV